MELGELYTQTEQDFHDFLEIKDEVSGFPMSFTVGIFLNITFFGETSFDLK